MSLFLQFNIKVGNLSALFTAVFPGPKSCLAQNRHAGYICRRKEGGGTVGEEERDTGIGCDSSTKWQS